MKEEISLKLPEAAERLIETIEAAGFEAYAVGGFVRDCLMNRQCGDVDIASSAPPHTLERILRANGIPFAETGLKHGTVTAITDGIAFEITSFRRDGEYSDFRHPQSVEFVTSLREDLARRDFTINAVAYNPKTGITDAFNGIDDINAKIIRAVGDPDKRFREDALRIMRALRFSSVLSFDIEEKTAQALFDNMNLLKSISAERIYKELTKLLMGRGVYRVMTEYKEILGVILPELKPIFSVEQNTRWHIYDVWHHTAKAVEQAPPDEALKYTMLLHDIGKAFTRTTDKNGTDHFKGHQKISAEYAESAMLRLKAPNAVKKRVMFLVPIHDMHIGTDNVKIKRWLLNIGEDRLRDLIAVKRADKAAQNPSATSQEINKLDITEKELNRIIKCREPYRIKDLAINGSDLTAMGISGEAVGNKLNMLINKVIDVEVENSRESLLKYLAKGA